MTENPKAKRQPLSNAQKQAAWRERHKNEAERLKPQIESLTTQLAAAQATITEQRDELAALARHIAKLTESAKT